MFSILLLSCVPCPSQVDSPLRCPTEAVLNGIEDKLKLMSRLERSCWRHVTKRRRPLRPILKDVELHRRSTHCSIYNALGGDVAQLCRGSHHRHNYSIARRRSLSYLGRHHCGLWQCKIADDMLSDLKQLVDGILDDRLPHQT